MVILSSHRTLNPLETAILQSLCKKKLPGALVSDLKSSSYPEMNYQRICLLTGSSFCCGHQLHLLQNHFQSALSSLKVNFWMIMLLTFCIHFFIVLNCIFKCQSQLEI
uniref:Uncharacterized protein n=1 Tax=Micrurus lemniscatus lemniscatus TaxID=129467 RepID=A0A2D4I338_MICLE